MPEENIKPVHPLEDKAWFRFLKVVYIAAWVVGALVLTILAASGEADDVVVYVGVALIGSIVLFALKKAFYYVVLGRTTAAERELGYREMASRFLRSWRMENAPRWLRTLIYLSVLFGGVIFGDWVIAHISNLSSDAVYHLMKLSLNLAVSGAVLAAAFARPWITFKTTVAATLLLSFGLLGWVWSETLVNGQDTAMAAATLTATKDLFDVETKIGAIKQRNLRTTDDYTEAYGEIEMLLPTLESDIHKCSDLYNNAPKANDTKSLVATLGIVRQFEALTVQETQTIHKMAMLPANERAAFLRKEFAPLMAQESALESLAKAESAK